MAAALAAFVPNATAEIPAGYYDSCDGKTGQALLTALCDKISAHTTVSYKNLWTVYKKSDVHADGSLWDMYSTKNWGTSFTKCGNYTVVGSCVNREHSFPKSWFNDASPMYSDAYHIYPTDGKVNGQRGNMPYGECANGTYLPSNGSVKPLGRLGTSTFSGYSGTVFEPDDQYKGDFARSYFYMAACYNDRIAYWDSDMLAGNKYPAFTKWAVNLLMKWTRQDEVSQKEIDRNDAVYEFQGNRNPFIDHPELAEYIWGDKVGEPWHPGGSVTPEIVQPLENASIDLGYAAVNIVRSVTVTIKGKNIDNNVTLTTTGEGFSVSPSVLTAEQANRGQDVTVSITGKTAGKVNGTLRINSGDIIRNATLTATIMDGLPIYDAANVSSETFAVRWVYLHDATDYTLHVNQGSQPIEGYPRQVTASAETYTVTGLEPLTTYTFYLTSDKLTSQTKSVTTADLIPVIDVMFDGDLTFNATPGTPSEVAELLLNIENVADDIVISVKSPFEISTDKSTWGTTVTLDPEEDRFYMRVNSAVEGTFTTFIKVTAGTYLNDDAEATAYVAETYTTAFLEDWEQVKDPTTSVSCYSTKTFQGTAAKWNVTDGGFGTDTKDKNFNNSVTLRMGKKATSTIAMNEDKTGGIGTVTFDAAKWGTDADATIQVEYSTDGGATWLQAEAVNISTSSASSYAVKVETAGNGRIRLRQESGSRWFVDNIGITDYSSLGAVNELYYHAWDAYCRESKLIIECRDSSINAAVYGMDGIRWFSDKITAGQRTIDLPKGLYIVVADDFARRVLIK